MAWHNLFKISILKRVLVNLIDKISYLQINDLMFEFCLSSSKTNWYLFYRNLNSVCDSGWE